MVAFIVSVDDDADSFSRQQARAHSNSGLGLEHCYHETAETGGCRHVATRQLISLHAYKRPCGNSSICELSMRKFRRWLIVLPKVLPEVTMDCGHRLGSSSRQPHLT